MGERSPETIRDPVVDPPAHTLIASACARRADRPLSARVFQPTLPGLSSVDTHLAEGPGEVEA